MTLKRPFAQINFLTDDIADAGKNGLTIDENTHSSITLSKVATTLNPFTNTVGGFTEAEVTFWRSGDSCVIGDGHDGFRSRRENV